MPRGDQAAPLEHVLGQRPAEHGLDIEDGQHAREQYAHSLGVAAALRRKQGYVDFGQLDRGHGAAGAAAQLVGDVAPAGTAEHTAQRGRCGRKHQAQALAAGQGFFLDVVHLRHGLGNLQHQLGCQPGTGRRRHVLQHHRQAARAGGDLLEKARLVGGRHLGRRGNHERADAAAAEFSHQAQRGGGVRRARAHDHGYPARHFGQHQPCQRHPFPEPEFAHFAGHAGVGDAVHAGTQQIAHQRLQAGLVRLPGGIKGRRQHRENAGQRGRVGNVCHRVRRGDGMRGMAGWWIKIPFNGIMWF